MFPEVGLTSSFTSRICQPSSAGVGFESRLKTVPARESKPPLTAFWPAVQAPVIVTPLFAATEYGCVWIDTAAVPGGPCTGPAFVHAVPVQTKRSPPTRYASPVVPVVGRALWLATVPTILRPAPTSPFEPAGPAGPAPPASPLAPAGPAAP